MITIKQHGRTLTLSRGDETFTLPIAEAPALIAAVLDQLGVRGTPLQQGYQLGRADGEQLGYAQRDREYVLTEGKAREARERAALLAAIAGDVRTA